MATVEFSLDNTEWKFAKLSGNQPLINLKLLRTSHLLIGLKITLQKCTYHKG